MGRLDHYVVGMILTPLVTIQAVAVVLLVLEQMLRLVDFVVAESGPFGLIWRMLAYLVPEYLGVALPVGLTLGVVLAVRRLSLAYEMHALQASGFSPIRILKPVYAVAAPLAVLSLIVIGYVQPLSNYEYSALKDQIRSGAFIRAFRVGEFLPIGDDATLRIGSFDPDEGVVRDIFLERCTGDAACTATTAQSGVLFGSEDGRRVSLRLRDGMEINFEIDAEKAGLITFEEQQVIADLPPLTPFRDRGSSPKEKTLGELFKMSLDDERASDAEFDVFAASLHWRLILTAFYLSIPLLAVPLGVSDPRRDTGVGVALSVVSVIVFIEVLETAESLVASGLASPWVLMWPVWGLFTLTSGALFWVLVRRVGGRPLEPIENAIGGLVAAVKRLAPRRRRRAPAHGLRV